VGVLAAVAGTLSSPAASGQQQQPAAGSRQVTCAVQ